jgi:dienelactone hydrolase
MPSPAPDRAPARCHVVLFHSAFGLRPAVLEAAARLRRRGHLVETPDLLEGEHAGSPEAALALRDRIGRAELVRRARASVAGAPRGTVLMGLSLGAALALEVAATDARFTRLLLLHGVAPPPSALPARWSVQAHLAAEDPWEPRAGALAWRARLHALGAHVDLHFYRGGHLFTDPGLPDHAPRAATAAWARAERFLAVRPPG